MHATEVEWLSLVLQVVYTVASIAIAVFAIWGEPLRARLAGPLLEIDLNEPVGKLITRANGVRTWYFHLKVRNRRPWSPAQDAIVQCVDIRHVDVNKQQKPLQLVSRLPLLWAFWQSFGIYRRIAAEEACDLGHVDENSTKFELELAFKDNSLDAAIEQNQALYVDLIISHRQGVSAQPVTVEIKWNGKWSEDPKIMRENLKISITHQASAAPV